MTDSTPDTAALSAASHRRLAATLREQAKYPAPNRLHKQYLDGFADGMRMAADVLDQLADLEAPDGT